jgi:hypothetical protein
LWWRINKKRNRRKAFFWWSQFKRLKYGDRFFYTHVNANGLGPVAKQEVLQVSII